MTTDALGNWIDLGSLEPDEDWAFFNVPAVNAETFRLTYTADWTLWSLNASRRSFALLRFYYFLPGAGLLMSEAGRLYPKQERELREYKIPSDLPNPETLQRHVGIKRVMHRRNQYVNVLPIPWTLQVEHL